MGKFDVLTEPWIPVASVDGQNMELSLTETLLRAHELSQVCCESPLETYAVQRFLIAFLMDAYRLERARDRKRLYEHGHFDKEVLDRYVELCRSEGVSFDLFDEKRPFYQAAFDEYDSKVKKESAVYLFHEIPSGNNAVHFEHRSRVECLPAEAFRALLAMQTFAASGGRGYARSLNGDPCWYVLLKGRYLFETLCLSMLSIAECAKIEFASVLPAWRNHCPRIAPADVSILEGLTFRPRKITLIENANGKIEHVFYQPGQRFDYKQNKRWRDPHAVYLRGEALVPKLGRMPWRDIGAFLLFKNDGNSIGSSAIIECSSNIISDNEQRTIMLFGIAVPSGKAKYLSWMKDSLDVPGEVLLDDSKSEALHDGIEKIEKAAESLSIVVDNMLKMENHDKRDEGGKRTKQTGKRKLNGIAHEAEAEFFMEMHRVVFYEYMDALKKADTLESVWENNPKAILTRAIRSSALRIATDFAMEIGRTARNLKTQAKLLDRFKRDIDRILY